MRKTIKSLLTIFFSICFSFAFSQETTSEIQGVVSGGSGGISNATIIATHLPTGTKYVTTSRKEGYYNLPNLRVGGPYEVKVTFIGYKEEKQDNITLLLGQSYRADFKLAINTSTLAEVTVAVKKQDKVFNSNRTGSQEIINRS